LPKFKERTGLSRTSFFLFKKAIEMGNLDLITEQYSYRNYKNVLEKDTCYFCRTQHDLQAHHIDLDRENNDKSNLVCLCERCHKRLHNLFYKRLHNLLKNSSEKSVRVIR
jgi:hypothetical protein